MLSTSPVFVSNFPTFSLLFSVVRNWIQKTRDISW